MQQCRWPMAKFIATVIFTTQGMCKTRRRMTISKCKALSAVGAKFTCRKAQCMIICFIYNILSAIRKHSHLFVDSISSRIVPANPTEQRSTHMKCSYARLHDGLGQPRVSICQGALVGARIRSGQQDFDLLQSQRSLKEHGARSSVEEGARLNIFSNRYRKSLGCDNAQHMSNAKSREKEKSQSFLSSSSYPKAGLKGGWR